MSRRSSYALGAGVMMLCGLLLFACTGPTKESDDESAIQRPVWPGPPEQARIEFVRSVAKPDDLGITAGFWRQLVGFFVGREEVRLVRPTSAVMTKDEVLYVADPGLKAVHRFDIPGKKHELLRREGDRAFVSPISLAIDNEDRVYVADSALDQVFLIDRQASHAVPFKTSVELEQPTGLAFDAARQWLYVVNTRGHRVTAFDNQGEALFSFGTHGAGPGEFNYPTQIWSDKTSGDLWVTDSLNFRVQRLTRKGEYIASFSSVGDATGDLPRPKGVATDSAGHVYVMDALLNTMQIFNPNGELLLYIGDQGRRTGQFWLPVGIFIDGQDRIFVADSFNNRVQVFRLLENKG